MNKYFNSIVFCKCILQYKTSTYCNFEKFKNKSKKKELCKFFFNNCLTVHNYSKFFSPFTIIFRTLNYYKFIYLFNQRITNLILASNFNDKKFLQIFHKKIYKRFFFLKFNVFQRLCYIIQKA